MKGKFAIDLSLLTTLASCGTSLRPEVVAATEDELQSYVCQSSISERVAGPK
jgi:hypothetical protein